MHILKTAKFYHVKFLIIFMSTCGLVSFLASTGSSFDSPTDMTPPMNNPHAPHPGPNTPPASGIVGLALHITATKIGDPARLIIRAVHPAGPAGGAGVTHGEEVVSVDGQAVSGKTYQEAVSMIRGEVGSSVKLGLQGPQGERTLSIMRVSEAKLMEQTPQTM